MTYFRTRMKLLRQEYKAKDRRQIIKDAGKCSMCERVHGDDFLFGPTHYIKKRIRFKVRLDVHVIEGMPKPNNRIVICDGCHISYHLFNRLEEEAEFGNTKLSENVYERCEKCKELTCMCCKKCGIHTKSCGCKDSDAKKLKKTKALSKDKGDEPPTKTVRVRSE